MPGRKTIYALTQVMQVLSTSFVSYATLTLLSLMSIGVTQTAIACTLGADNNCSGQAEPDATTTVVRSRPNTSIGNPISLITGNKYQRETDFKLANSRLSFHRHYNSRNTDFNFGFGRGWTTTYSANLKRIVNSDSE